MVNEELQVKELPSEFRGIGEVRGFHFKRVSKTDRGYIYSVMNNGQTYYEVFKRKTNQYRGISYPKSKSFGKWAWWYSSLEKAQIKLNSL